ncbi:FIG00461427: hypothetical protein [Caballeronia glathei]|uniref:Uncharacterized protein n=1 Tax=Caballeronia glathei TaxID=60547 RepID=A0A069PKD2_9BURK|nr:hypothetical protein [Caballeronia glathei]KDR41138.1 hypothetical protein BG61_20725 [Caballeronia glathei]CDY77963.1 FIG00461427: hypothetical protein [Caballeronia glathei]
MAFRDLVADLDAAVVRDLADDDIKVDGVPVPGMFAAPWLGPDLGHQRTQLDHPQVSVRDSDAVRMREGSVVEVGEERYTVFELQPDGTGWTVLLLKG